MNLSAKLKQLQLAIILSAFEVYNFKGVLASHGVFVHQRRAAVITSTVMKGVAIIIEIIMLVIAGYFTALLVPGMLTSIATTALTSVNSAIVTLFQTILPFVIVTVIIMLFLSVLVETFRSL